MSSKTRLEDERGTKLRRAPYSLLSFLLALSAALLGIRCRDGASLQTHSDFVEDFPAAETRFETAQIQFGTAAARAHFVEGWSADETWSDGTPDVWSLGDHSTLDFYLGEPRPLSFLLTCLPLSFADAPEQTMTVQVNGHAVADLRLHPGRGDYTVAVPDQALVAGENRITFGYGFHRRPIDVLPGSKDTRSLAVAWYRMSIAPLTPGVEPAVDRQGKPPALLLPFASRISYAFRAPAQAELSVSALTRWGSGTDGSAAANLRVEVSTEGNSRTIELSVPSGTRSLPLALPVGRPARISFIAPGSGSGRGIRIEKPRLLSAPQTHPPGCDAELPWAEAPRPNVLVYLIDTLRADHLGCYGDPRGTSPHIDAFATESVRFAHTVAQSGCTRPTVASIFTGLTPPLHGALLGGDVLAASHRTMASRMREAGYATAGIVTNSNVAPSLGFGQGFDTYEYLPEQHTPEMHQLSDVVNEHAFAWLRSRPRDRPFFLYLHTTDPHDPYMPRSPYRERFAAGIDPALGLHLSVWKRNRTETASARDIHDLAALYDGEIAFVDEQFGRLLDELRELGLYDSTLIVLIADHGEEFHEHGTWTHSNNLFTETTHVPLLIKLPKQWGGGTVSDGLAQQVDLLPTVLQACGVEIPAGLQGSSLLPRLLCPASAGADPIVYSYLGGKGYSVEMDSVVVDGLALMHYAHFPKARPVLELYDLAADPGEQHDIAPRRPVETAYLLAQLKRFELLAPKAEPAPTAVIDPALKERLRALGYLP